MGKGLVLGVIGAVVLVIILVAIYFIAAGTSEDEVTVAAGMPPYGPLPSSGSPPPASLPAGLAEGDVVQCQKTAAVSKIVNGKLSWYPNPAIWAKYGNPPYRVVDCDVLATIPQGPNMEHMSASAVFKPERMTTMADVYKV